MKDDESLASVQFWAPCQWVASRRSRVTLSGEHRLLFAILADAVALYVDSMSSERGVVRHEAHGARAWFESRDCSWPFSFEFICDQLGLDAGYIRRGLRSVRAQRAAARLAAGSSRPDVGSEDRLGATSHDARRKSP